MIPLEQQVASLPLAKRLKELGTKQESLYSWQYYPHTDSYALQTMPVGSGLNIAAFTVAELGEMLPRACEYHHVLPTAWVVRYEAWEEMADTEADARAKMLIYLIENHLITI